MRRSALDIQSVRDGFGAGGGWLWKLPRPCPGCAQPGDDGPSGGVARRTSAHQQRETIQKGKERSRHTGNGSQRTFDRRRVDAAKIILPCKDIVVVDNVSFHKVGGVQEAIQARGAELR
jgi:hypothetical protein